MKTEWAVEDRPREKFTKKGASSLTDVELVAGVLGTGTASEHVIDVAKNMLDEVENDLGRLMALTVNDLKRIRGVGYVKALRFKMAAELVRRTQIQPVPKDFKVVTSHDAFRVFAPYLGDLPHEEFWICLLNRRAKIIDKAQVSRGGLSSTIADPRVIFRIALDMNASSVIVAHNHPSGSLNPSQADIDLTKKLAGGAKLLDLQLVDHLIISGNNYCSFADSGLL